MESKCYRRSKKKFAMAGPQKEVVVQNTEKERTEFGHEVIRSTSFRRVKLETHKKTEKVAKQESVQISRGKKEVVQFGRCTEIFKKCKKQEQQCNSRKLISQRGMLHT